MKRILYFFVAVSVFVFISCGSDNSTANTQKLKLKKSLSPLRLLHQPLSELIGLSVPADIHLIRRLLY